MLTFFKRRQWQTRGSSPNSTPAFVPVAVIWTTLPCYDVTAKRQLSEQRDRHVPNASLEVHIQSVRLARKSSKAFFAVNSSAMPFFCFAVRVSISFS